jgi:hypothetical protein
MIYSEIYDLCRVKSQPAIKYGEEISNRGSWIIGLLDQLGIEYKVETFKTGRRKGWNIVLPTDLESGVRCVSAHYDIVNPLSDNANDNSASVINAIATKILRPETLVVLTDWEEFGGYGANHFAKQVINGKYGEVEWILNYELTGRGGESFFVGSSLDSPLMQICKGLFNPPKAMVPFNDSFIFRKNGIDSVVINPTPKRSDGTLDFSPLGLCHSMEDSVDLISLEEMKTFVEKIAIPILNFKTN